MKKGVVIAWLLLLAICMGMVWWRIELRYRLPTPVPADYHDVPAGSAIPLPIALSQTFPSTDKPVFLHFFNPDCPCSRFNIPHFRSLAQQYGQKVFFAVVIMTDKAYTGDEVRHRFDLPASMPVIRDTALAGACGVYSTPQAVILDAHDKLFYRGNYNRNRYCTDEKSSFARIALDGLLRNQPALHFSELALRAYGCQLPRCTQ